MQLPHSDQSIKKGVRLIFIATFVILGLWFAKEAVSILFLFFFAVVLMLILNAPTTWLVKNGMNRTLAALIVFLLMLAFLFLIGWLVVPKILEQVTSLITNLPQYYTSLQQQAANQLQDYPELRSKVLDPSALQENMPSIRRVAMSIGQVSYSLVAGVFLTILFLSVVVYMLINPAPLVSMYLTLFPVRKRKQAALALAKASKMMVAWMWSNLVVGSIEGVAVFFFLSYMGVPGVWVWTGLALFAEMVPKLGLYIMAIPPVLIALSIDPMTALWVLIFYLALNEIMGDFVVPRIRASAMNLHPVSTIFVMLAMGSVFGLMGALVATPLTAFIKAYYETFYLSRVSKEGVDKEVEMVLNRKAGGEGSDQEDLPKGRAVYR